MAVREVLKKLKAAPELLILIHRNLSWSLISRRLSASEAGGEDCCRLARGRSPEEFRNLSFMILELVFSVAYSSIILGEPTGIDEMEPCLLDAVARLLR
jgi:hypothetical protein